MSKRNCFSNRKLQSTVEKNSNCERFSSGQFFLNRTLQSTVKKIRTVKGLARVIFFWTERCSLQSRKIRTVKGLARVNFLLNRTLQSTVKKNSTCERFSSGQFFLSTKQWINQSKKTVWSFKKKTTSTRFFLAVCLEFCRVFFSASKTAFTQVDLEAQEETLFKKAEQKSEKSTTTLKKEHNRIQSKKWFSKFEFWILKFFKIANIWCQ